MARSQGMDVCRIGAEGRSKTPTPLASRAAKFYRHRRQVVQERERNKASEWGTAESGRHRSRRGDGKEQNVGGEREMIGKRKEGTHKALKGKRQSPSGRARARASTRARDSHSEASGSATKASASMPSNDLSAMLTTRVAPRVARSLRRCRLQSACEGPGTSVMRTALDHGTRQTMEHALLQHGRWQNEV
eukprot:6204670-Pleurochrysis_carterae.AAC.2